MNEVTTTDFLDWNLSLNTNLSLCAIQLEYNYCSILNSSYTTTTSPASIAIIKELGINCDINLYTNLNDIDTRAVCVKVGSSTSTTTTTTLSSTTTITTSIASI
ncbi:unnamed protein product [Penicillium salamii]|uniref:Uncharacterized protein n=1 Tax=Penicillium salamii TaxID=1612424 RepID=A0A9W4IG63_9EURO|nr:unnamed protein product [Penicillium salamii]